MKPRFRQFRLEMKLTQEQMANCLHITRQAYNMYETGYRQASIDFLIAFADFTKISLDTLVGRNPGTSVAEDILYDLSD